MKRQWFLKDFGHHKYWIREKKVRRLLEVLNFKYINLFDHNIDSEVRNLSSEVALPPEVTDNILSIVTSGHNQYELFDQERLIEKN